MYIAELVPVEYHRRVSEIKFRKYLNLGLFSFSFNKIYIVNVKIKSFGALGKNFHSIAMWSSKSCIDAVCGEWVLN